MYTHQSRLPATIYSTITCSLFPIFLCIISSIRIYHIAVAHIKSCWYKGSSWEVVCTKAEHRLLRCLSAIRNGYSSVVCSVVKKEQHCDNHHSKQSAKSCRPCQCWKLRSGLCRVSRKQTNLANGSSPFSSCKPLTHSLVSKTISKSFGTELCVQLRIMWATLEIRPVISHQADWNPKMIP